ncbi:MAG: hypothetical protein SVR94_10805 [Pseudomonadota bacterium]|nr:hypothetical protein [Pseudomonadota bacterium]
MIEKIKTIGVVLLLLIATALGGGKAYIDYQLNHQFKTQLQKQFDKLSLSQVRLSWLGTLLLQHVQLLISPYPPLSIAQVRIPQVYHYYGQRWPAVSQMVFQDVTLSLEHYDTSIPMIMNLLGYSRYAVSMQTLRDLGYAILTVDTITVTLFKQAPQLKLEMQASHLGQLTVIAHLTASPQTLSLEALKHSQLTELNLIYRAGKIIDDIFTHLAQRNKMTLSDLKQNLIAQLHQDLNRAKVNADILKGLAEFIQTPSQLMIQLQPHSPVSITAMMSTELTQWRLTLTSE